MKKFFKVFLSTTFVLGFGALIGCYIFMPNETKLAIDVVMDYLNRPLPIIGVSIIAIGGVALTFLKTTSIGKKSLNQLESDFDTLKVDLKEKETKSKEYFEQAKLLNEETKVVLSEYSNEIDNLINNLVKVCETTPNAKVKALAKDILGQANNYKNELEMKVNELNTDINQVLVEKANVETLNTKVNELETLIKDLVEKYEKE